MALGTKTKGNVFQLNSVEVSCLMAKVDDNWLWHRRIFHINFDNIVKESGIKEIRDLPRIIKPTNTMCRECVMGKKTKSNFQGKSFSAREKLDLVHTDPCGPTKTRSYHGERYFIIIFMTVPK